jgi:hypothetical protein
MVPRTAWSSRPPRGHKTLIIRAPCALVGRTRSPLLSPSCFWLRLLVAANPEHVEALRRTGCGRRYLHGHDHLADPNKATGIFGAMGTAACSIRRRRDAPGPARLVPHGTPKAE